MSELSLRSYFQKKGIHDQGIRSTVAPDTNVISLRALMSSSVSASRIIHISDLHFSAFPITWNLGAKYGLWDEQKSIDRMNIIAKYLIENKHLFGTLKVFITGDITDSGDELDYKIAYKFVEMLKKNGFSVFPVPGNHDYCWEGHTITESIPPLPPFVDQRSNKERRDSFNNYFNPRRDKYPRTLFVDNLVILLLDSMQAQIDEENHGLAQGKLGGDQLDSLESWLKFYQEYREKGFKILVAMHHSPFSSGWDGLLEDRGRFLEIIDRKIDCLVFGHTTPDNVFYQPNDQPNDADSKDWILYYENLYRISIINCENLENVPPDASYPITVLDLESLERIIYQTDGTPPKPSFKGSNLKNWELSISMIGGGSTNPHVGYHFPSNTLNVTAIDTSKYSFAWWEFDGKLVSLERNYSVPVQEIGTRHTLLARFEPKGV